MIRILGAAVLALALAPLWSAADPGDDRGRDYWKHLEKMQKEQRKAEEKYWKEVEKRRKEEDKRWRERRTEERWDASFLAPPAHEEPWLHDPPRHDQGHYGHEGGYGYDYGDYDPGQYGQGYYEQPWPPRSDRPVTIRTPFGYYQETPRSPHHGHYGPRLEGHGQVGPYRFEVWR